MPALAMGIKLPFNFFDSFHETADNQLRLLHYPEAERQAFLKGEKGRIGAHTVCLLPAFLFWLWIFMLHTFATPIPLYFYPVYPVGPHPHSLTFALQITILSHLHFPVHVPVSIPLPYLSS